MTHDSVPMSIRTPSGFIKLKRSDATRELLKDPKAFALLTTIALRAKRTGDFNVQGLKPGQALVGDHTSYGLSRREYRNAKVRLQRYGLARFRGTNRGTIATLLDTSVYDINEEGTGQTKGTRRAIKGPSEDQQGATIKNGKNDKKEKKKAETPRSCSSRLAAGGGAVARTFEEMDRDRARQALAQAKEEFLTDDEA